MNAVPGLPACVVWSCEFHVDTAILTATHPDTLHVDPSPLHSCPVLSGDNVQIQHAHVDA